MSHPKRGTFPLHVDEALATAWGCHTNTQLNEAWDRESERVAAEDCCRGCEHLTAERVLLEAALALRTRELEQLKAEMRRLRDELDGTEDERCGRLIT